jgi:hypothetical protein
MDAAIPCDPMQDYRPIQFHPVEKLQIIRKICRKAFPVVDPDRA